MSVIPQPLFDLIDSLTLHGLPTSVTPGDKIVLSITPDLAPKDGALSDVLKGLSNGKVLGKLEVDVDPLIAWLVRALEVQGWAKAVEFDQPVIGATAAQLEMLTPVKRALSHLVPDTTPALNVSQYVEGLITRAKLARDQTAGLASTVTGTVTAPGVNGVLSQPEVDIRVLDESGTELQDGNGYFKSLDFVPALVFLPVAVPSVTQQPSIRRTIFVDISISYTAPGAPGAPISVDKTLGPFPLDLATVEVPVVALLARHALTPGAAPGYVFVGVPGNSPLNGVGDIIAALAPIRGVVSNVNTVLRAFGIPIPGSLADALRALDFIAGVRTDFRFAKGDLLGLFALFADWQFIMSAAMIFGSASRRVFYATPVIWSARWAGFSLYPGLLGIGFIPDLNVAPIGNGVTVGRVTDDMPLPVGTYDNTITSLNFPAN